MSHLFSISAVFLSAALLGGCASTPLAADATATPLRLQAQGVHLRLAAEHLLHTAGVQVAEEDSTPTLPLLQLSEVNERSIESLLADGSAGSYTLHYKLTYQLGSAAAQEITRVQVVDYDENQYRASARQQESMVQSLRRSALAQMIISLQLH